MKEQKVQKLKCGKSQKKLVDQYLHNASIHWWRLIAHRLTSNRMTLNRGYMLWKRIWAGFRSLFLLIYDKLLVFISKYMKQSRWWASQFTHSFAICTICMFFPSIISFRWFPLTSKPSKKNRCSTVQSRSKLSAISKYITNCKRKI